MWYIYIYIFLSNNYNFIKLIKIASFLFLLREINFFDIGFFLGCGPRHEKWRLLFHFNHKKIEIENADIENKVKCCKLSHKDPNLQNLLY